MSAYNKKTLNFEAFKVYLKQKNALNKRLAPFYNKYLFRKLKLGSYIRRQITEARMLKRFEELFGSPQDAVVCIGDWEQKQHRKFKEPVKGKGFRTLFLSVVNMRCAQHSERVTTLDPTDRDASCAMVLSSVVLVRGCGTEM